ncbi:MAG: glycosyltransferase family 2 protein [Anaerolineales bacterium]|nr:glycosyltransferase family 2 protein [Anaerolineales bacterium]
MIQLPSTPSAIYQWLNGNPLLGEHCFFWNDRLGVPPMALVEELSQQPVDVWHAGLALGMGGKPALMDFVNPIWRFNKDPDIDLEATSWRLSLQACLVRSEVLQKLGGPVAQFQTMSGASLELGYRWIRLGAIMRHRSDLVPANIPISGAPTPEDELRFVRLRFGRSWHHWAFGRALLTGYFSPRQSRNWWVTRKALPQLQQKPLRSAKVGPMSATAQQITVLIPTLQRYPYLFKLLRQLRKQTIQAHQIIVVDQTPIAERQTAWPANFRDLPLEVIWQDEPGQCSSRNAGLNLATGDYILFLDDDDQIPDNLIAAHLAFLANHPADASCGIAHEVDAGALPEDFTYPRDSDVFPTNNVLLRRTALRDSGLFDLAYERGSRADGDLGMRLYLAGKQLLLNPAAEVIHLHVPRGGLRHHKARLVTRANSRKSISRRHLLAPTEAYLWHRFFTPRQISEACLIRSVATLKGNNVSGHRLLRILLMILLLPVTIFQNRQRLQTGINMGKSFPQIPTYKN